MIVPRTKNVKEFTGNYLDTVWYFDIDTCQPRFVVDVRLRRSIRDQKIVKIAPPEGSSPLS